MAIENEIKKFKILFDRELDVFLSAKIRETKNISPVAADMMGTLRKYILQSGKRIRPVLFYHTYQTLGGKPAVKKRKEALKAAMAIELAHTFLLIHDDVIDRDNLRRGKPSVQYIYRLSKEKEFANVPDAIHYGNSQAICVGDVSFSLVNEIIADLKLDLDIKNRLFKKIGNIIFNTAIGEFYDVYAAAEKNISKKDILTILEYKTARYTVEGPIHLGAMMAGAGERTMKNLSEYSIPLGIAFQIQDDILGVYGASMETGKPVGADIREGKKTLLVAKALESGNAEQKAKISAALGNEKITNGEIEEIKRIIKETGSLEYSQKLAKKLCDDSQKALFNSKFDKKSKEFFAEVADFIIKRDH